MLSWKPSSSCPYQVLQNPKHVMPFNFLVDKCWLKSSVVLLQASHVSDHEMVYCIRLTCRNRHLILKVSGNYNPVHFCQDLKGVCNTFIPNGFVTNVDQLWHDFKSAFVSVADRHAPIIQRRVRGTDNCPWLNKEIKSVMRKRNFFHSKARKFRGLA